MVITKCKPVLCTAAIGIGIVGAVVYGMKFIFTLATLLATAVPLVVSIGVVLVAHAIRTDQKPKVLLARLTRRMQTIIGEA